MCEKVNIRFYCYKCDNIDCQYANKLGYIYDSSNQGCSRKISLDDFSRYEHYINEIIPFWKIIDNKDLINEQYKEIISFLENKIYPQEIINFYDKNNKVISKKELIKYGSS